MHVFVVSTQCCQQAIVTTSSIIIINQMRSFKIFFITTA